ncbi:hypothetical protein [Bacteroides sp. 14(A)]|uniref:hypothetical protein n=1 Tax=Bacteroides sp. 14(A) TaxID=1163670 RepID=UPI0012DE5664|nr:hypothetical protein [Bacteroides sp. 14(A)]
MNLKRGLSSTTLTVLYKLVKQLFSKAVVDGNYQNITGDLRSSIGYVIAYNGKIIKEGGFL